MVGKTRKSIKIISYKPNKSRKLFVRAILKLVAVTRVLLTHLKCEIIKNITHELNMVCGGAC